MSILTYKQYKLLNENLDSVIGISAPTNVGLQTEAPQLYNMMSKMAKKMHGGLHPKKPPMGDDEDMDHPEPDADDMGGPPDMDADDMGDMGNGDDDADDMGDEDMGDEDMGDEEGDEDMGDDEEGDEDMGDMGADMGADMDMGPLGAGSPPPGMGGPMIGPDMGMGLGGPPMKGKGKKVPPMMMKKMQMGGMSMKPSYMRKEAADPQDAKMKGQNRKNGANDQNDCGPGPASKKTTTVREAGDPQDAKMKGQNRKNGANDQNDAGPGPASKKTTTVREEAHCCEKCGKMSKKCNKMTKEQREFNDSLMRQAGSLKFQQDEYGYWVPVKEDVLIQRSKVETPAESEPQPGEVGFAPVAKIGSILGSSFTEWASRHIEAVKNKK